MAKIFHWLSALYGEDLSLAERSLQRRSSIGITLFTAKIFHWQSTLHGEDVPLTELFLPRRSFNGKAPPVADSEYDLYTPRPWDIVQSSRHPDEAAHDRWPRRAGNFPLTQSVFIKHLFSSLSASEARVPSVPAIASTYPISTIRNYISNPHSRRALAIEDTSFPFEISSRLQEQCAHS